MLNKRNRHKRVQTTCFHLHKVQIRAKLSYAIRSGYSLQKQWLQESMRCAKCSQCVFLMRVLVIHILSVCQNSYRNFQILVNEAHFPRSFLIDISIGAIIQVHLNKLSWDCFPKASPQQISRPDVLPVHPLFSSTWDSSFNSQMPNHHQSKHPQPSKLSPLLQGLKIQAPGSSFPLQPAGQIAKSYSESNVLGSFMSWLNLYPM